MKKNCFRRAPTRALRYVWASPTTLLGLSLALLTWLTGGRLERRNGVLEISRGLSRSVLESPRLNAGAITLGHVIVARDARSMDLHRAHELGHVHQAERLGPFFLPAYFAAAVVARVRGGHHYRDNWFERDAERYARSTADTDALDAPPTRHQRQHDRH